jgi:hypothetical protein
MKLKQIVAIAVLITQSIYAQNTSSKGKSTNIIVKAGIGYGFRLGKTPPNISREQKQIIENLSTGIVYDLGLYCRINDMAAVGFKYNCYSANSPASNSFDPSIISIPAQNDVISFYGASYLLDQKSNNSRHEGNIELALGYIDYRSSIPTFNNFQSYGSTFGMVGNLSYKYRVLTKLSIGPTLNFVGGTIREFKVTANNGYSATISLPKDSYESLWRIDFGFEAIYRL